MQSHTTHKSAIQKAIERSDDRTFISFALGLPASDLFPLGIIAKAATLATQAPLSFQYRKPEALIKSFICDLLVKRGMHVSEDNIFLTTGAQQGLHLIAALLTTAKHGYVLTNAELYPGFKQVAEMHRLECLELLFEEGGEVNMTMMKRLLAARGLPSFIYTMSAGHNPLSATMTANTRESVMAFASAFRIPVVEDDVYGLLQYGDMDEPCLLSSHFEGNFYIGSFSKILAPSLRIGWIVVSSETTAALSVLKEASDLNISTFSQAILANILWHENLFDHIALLRSGYRLRRDAMQLALESEMDDATIWAKPQAGFFFWITNDSWDTDKILEVSLAEGVGFLPGSAFSLTGNVPSTNSMRLAFSGVNPLSIAEGVKRLGRVLRTI